MSKVKDGNYVVVQSFMVKELGLKGNELLTYAIVYGFSQDDQRFSGSLQYIADWCNCSKQTAISSLKSLCASGLLQKFEIERNGVKFCEYRANYVTGIQESLIPGQNSLLGRSKNFNGGGQNSLPGGGQKSLPNNLGSNNQYHNLGENQEDNKVGRAFCQYDLFRETYNLCKNLPNCRTLTENRKKAIRTFLKDFTAEQWKEICRLADKSKFLTGHNDRKWKADIDFLLRPDKAAKILEGGYQDEKENDNGTERKPTECADGYDMGKVGLWF